MTIESRDGFRLWINNLRQNLARSFSAARRGKLF